MRQFGLGRGDFLKAPIFNVGWRGGPDAAMKAWRGVNGRMKMTDTRDIAQVYLPFISAPF